MSSLEFGGVFIEDMGAFEHGLIRFTDAGFQFKNDKTGKVTNVTSGDIEDLKWQRLGNKQGLRVGLTDGDVMRFGGFKEADYDKISGFSANNWSQKVEQNELVIKGWNYGNAEVKGKSIHFSWDDKPIYEIPCSNVSQCNGNKNEVTLEFHQNDDCPISLSEMRFHMPLDPDDDESDPVEEFKKAVLAFAGLEQETDQPIAAFTEILCTTPRGRYDIKIFPNHVSLHGKTYDYKIPMKSITRLFLVPHRDGRHVFFVLSLNPPIRQGQTRYSYLVFEFVKDEVEDITLGLTDDELRDQYNGKLSREMNGPIFETVSIIFKVMCNLKITVPGKFIGHSGTPAIQCSHKQNSGLLYPMEKGFLYIHKPPMYMRFEEVSSIHFARSDGAAMRTFDFEIELNSGVSLPFNGVEKEEYNKLYDYASSKGIRIRNAKKMESKYVEDRFAGSDDDIDPYKAAVKAEGRAREESDDDSEDDDYDLDADMKKRKADERESSEGSGSEPDDEYDSGSASDDSGTGESEPDEEQVSRKKKPKEGGVQREKKEKKEKGGGEKEKKKKDPNAPKRATTAYFLWLNANRPSIKKDGDTVADTAKRAGEMWKKMDSDDKKEWEEKAAEDKERYQEEMKEYKKSGGASAFATSSSSSKTTKTKKSTGPSPSKAKSKEYISSDDSDSEEEPKPKKKEKRSAPKDEDDENSSDVSDDGDSDD